MNTSKRTPLFWVLLVIGLVCTLTMLSMRIFAEYNDNKVSFAVSYEQVCELSKADGKTPSMWLFDLHNIGVSHLIVTDANEAEAKTALGDVAMSIARSGDTAKPGDSFLIPEMRDGYVFAYDKPLGDSNVPLALVENPFRTNVVMPDEFDPERWSGPMVKTLYMFDAYSYHWQMQEPATENENILFRAIADRGMRLIILTPLVDESKTIVTDFSAYTDLMSGLKQRCLDRGITIGKDFSSMNAPVTNPPLVAGTLLLLAVVFFLFISLLLPLTRKYEYIILSLLTVGAFGAALVLTSLAQKLGAFGASLVFACYAALLLVRISQNKTKRNLFVRFSLSLLSMLAIGLSGGFYISALLGTRPYMMQFEIFSGVKISQLFPIAFCGLVLAYVLFNKKARSERDNSNKLPIPLIVFMGVCVIAALIILVLRSGDNMLPVSNLEINFRNWLEYVLYTRPRTKEMFLAFPALALYIVASDRKFPIFQLPLGVLASIGACSVINTFCHIFTPVHVSFIRTLLSAVIGFVIGIIGMYIFSFLLGKKQIKEKINNESN